MPNNNYYLRILIVDDNDKDALRLKKKLDNSRFDHDIVIENNPRKAVSVVIDPENVVKPFDLAIVDYWMNGKMGDELALELKKIDPDMEIIILTSDTDPELEDKFFNMDELQPKGFHIKTNDDVLQSVTYILSNKVAKEKAYGNSIGKRIKNLQNNIAKFKLEGKYV